MMYLHYCELFTVFICMLLKLEFSKSRLSRLLNNLYKILSLIIDRECIRVY